MGAGAVGSSLSRLLLWERRKGETPNRQQGCGKARSASLCRPSPAPLLPGLHSARAHANDTSHWAATAVSTGSPGSPQRGAIWAWPRESAAKGSAHRALGEQRGAPPKPTLPGLHLLCRPALGGPLATAHLGAGPEEWKEAARVTGIFPCFQHKVLPILHTDHSWIQTKRRPTCQHLLLFPGSHSDTELSMRIRKEALKKSSLAHVENEREGKREEPKPAAPGPAPPAWRPSRLLRTPRAAKTRGREGGRTEENEDREGRKQ